MPTRRAVSLLLPARQLLSIFAALRARGLPSGEVETPARRGAKGAC